MKRHMMKKGILLMGMLSLLTACSSGIDGKKYQDMKPEFVLEEYFNGPIKAWGIVQDRSGNVINRFEADMVGTWDGNQGVLDEDFVYLDTGEEKKRIWKITKIDDLTYEGRADDIIGTATGTPYGNAVRWTYEMDIDANGKTYRLKFDDWIWAMNDGVIINRSYLKKFGITFAEVTIFMQKQDQ